MVEYERFKKISTDGGDFFLPIKNFEILHQQ